MWQHPAFLLSLVWAAVLHLVFWRLYLPTDAVDFAVRAGFMFCVLNFASEKAWTRCWMQLVIALFLLPMAALFLRQDFLYSLSRLSVVAGILVWTAFSPPKRRDRWDYLYLAMILIWGFWLCQEIVDANSGLTGWYWRLNGASATEKLGEDGLQYLSLGQNLKDLFSTMYRLPGFPLLTRVVMGVLGHNADIFVVGNMLCLIATVHISVQFANRFYAKPWCRPLLLMVFAIYLSGHRLVSYRSVITDPLNDLILIAHLIYLFDFMTSSVLSPVASPGMSAIDLRAISNRPRLLRRTFQTLLIALFLRPTVIYYSIALGLALTVWSWRHKLSVGPPLRALGLWILIPLLVLTTFHRIRHGVFAFSSMPAHVLSFCTYGTMLALKNSTDLKSAWPIVQKELLQWRAQNNAEKLGLSEDGIVTTFDRQFVAQKFRQAPKLFRQAITVGLQQLLLFQGGYVDLIIVVLAVALLIWSSPWWLLLLWPLYLIPVYTLEGLAMEYRLTLQITLPLLVLILARLPQVLRLQTSSSASVEGPVGGHRQNLLAPNTIDIRTTQLAFYLSLAMLSALAIAPLARKQLVETSTFAEDLKQKSVIAVAWSGDHFLYRKKSSMGQLQTLQTMSPSHGPASPSERIETELFAQNLMPQNYADPFEPTPRQNQRLGLLGPLHLNATTPLRDEKWLITLNSLPIATLSAETTLDASEKWRLQPQAWLAALTPATLTALLDWSTTARCTILMEQIKSIESGRSSVDTTFYSDGRNPVRGDSAQRWSDRFSSAHGYSENHEFLTLPMSPLAELCRLVRDGQVITRIGAWHVDSVEPARMTEDERVLHLRVREKPEIEGQFYFKRDGSGWSFQRFTSDRGPLHLRIARSAP